MQKLSVVIVCKNEADVIGATLESLRGLTDDIVIYDNGSTDATEQIVSNYLNAHWHSGNWEGFGKTKNKADSLAKYDWILSLDADESIDEELKKSLLQLDLSDEKIVYEIKFKSFIGSHHIRFGEWGNDKHIRLFNRREVNWNDAPVHEELILSKELTIKKLTGFVLHRTVKNFEDYLEKTKNYARLSAEKYFQQGKKTFWFQILLSPAFGFIKHYFFQLGFLDGKEGYLCARMTARYTFLKYSMLKKMWQKTPSKQS